MSETAEFWMIVKSIVGLTFVLILVWAARKEML